MVHDLQIQSVSIANGIPVSHAGAAQGIHADANFASRTACRSTTEERSRT